MLERANRGLSTSLEYRLRGKTACRNRWPRYTPKLCEHSGNRRENQEQKALNFLDSLHSFLDKNSVNERAPFPRVYASLVSSVGSNEQWRLFLYICILWLAEHISLKKAAEGSWKFSFTVFRSVLTLGFRKQNNSLVTEKLKSSRTDWCFTL